MGHVSPLEGRDFAIMEDDIELFTFNLMDERARASKIILFQSVVGPILAQVIALAYVYRLTLCYR